MMDNSEKNVSATSEKLERDQKGENNNTIYQNNVDLPRLFTNINVKLPSLFDDANADDDNDDDDDDDDDDDEDNDNDRNIVDEKISNNIDELDKKKDTSLYDEKKESKDKSLNKDTGSNKTFSLTSSANDGVSENMKAIHQILTQFKNNNVSTKTEISFELERLGSYMLNGELKTNAGINKDVSIPVKSAPEIQKLQMYLLYILEHINQNLSLIENAQVQMSKLMIIKANTDACELNDNILQQENNLKKADIHYVNIKPSFNLADKQIEEDILSVEELSWDDNFLNLDRSRKIDNNNLFKSLNILNIKNLGRSIKYENAKDNKYQEAIRTSSNSTISLASSLINGNKEELNDANAQINSKTEIIEKSTSFTELKNRFEKLKFNTNTSATSNQNHYLQHTPITTTTKIINKVTRTTPVFSFQQSESKECPKSGSKTNLSYQSFKTTKDETFETGYDEGMAIVTDPPLINQEEMIDNSAFLVSSIESITMDSTLSTAIHNKTQQLACQQTPAKPNQNTKSSDQSPPVKFPPPQISAFKNESDNQYAFGFRNPITIETEVGDQGFKMSLSDNAVTEYNSQQSSVSKLKTPIVVSNEHKRESVLPNELNHQIHILKTHLKKTTDIIKPFSSQHSSVSKKDKIGHFVEIEQNNGCDDSNQVLVENADNMEMVDSAKANLLLSEGEIIASPNCKISDMNIYVRSCENEPIVKTPNYHYMKELVDTERTYVNGLHVLSEILYSKIKAANVISLKNFNYIFPESIHQIHKFHLDFSSCLNSLFQQSLNLEVLKRVNKFRYNKNKQQPIKIGQLFLEFIEKNNWKFFQIYRQYLSKSKNAISMYNKLKRSSPKFDRLCKTLQMTDHCSGLDLSSYLVLPIQRLPRYLMILRKILENLDSTETEERVSILAVEHLMDSFLKEADKKSAKKFEEKESALSSITNNAHDLSNYNCNSGDTNIAASRLASGINTAGSLLRRGSSFHTSLKQSEDIKVSVNDSSINTISSNNTAKLFKSKTMKKFWASSQSALNTLAGQVNNSPPECKESQSSFKDTEKTMSESMSQYDFPSFEESHSSSSNHNRLITHLFQQTANTDFSSAIDRRVYTYHFPSHQSTSNKTSINPLSRKSSPKLLSCPINSTNLYSTPQQLQNNKQQIDNKTIQLSRKISLKEHKKPITKTELMTIKTENNPANKTEECAVCLNTQDEFEVDTCNEEDDERTCVPARVESRNEITTTATPTLIANQKCLEFQVESIPSLCINSILNDSSHKTSSINTITRYKKTPTRVLNENRVLTSTNIGMDGLGVTNESKLTGSVSTSSAPPNSRKLINSLSLTTILHELLMNEIDKIINKKVHRSLVILAHVTIESSHFNSLPSTTTYCPVNSSETTVKQKPIISNPILESPSPICMQPPDADVKSQSDFSVSTISNQSKKFSLRQLFSLKKKGRLETVAIESSNYNNSISSRLISENINSSNSSQRRHIQKRGSFNLQNS